MLHCHFLKSETQPQIYFIVAVAYLSSCYRTASGAILDDVHTFRCNNYFVYGRTCTEVFSDPMFLRIFSNTSLSLLLVGSHQAEIIIVKCLIQGRNNVTRMRVEPRLC